MRPQRQLFLGSVNTIDIWWLSGWESRPSWWSNLWRAKWDSNPCNVARHTYHNVWCFQKCGEQVICLEVRLNIFLKHVNQCEHAELKYISNSAHFIMHRYISETWGLADKDVSLLMLVSQTSYRHWCYTDWIVITALTDKLLNMKMNDISQFLHLVTYLFHRQGSLEWRWPIYGDYLQ